MINFQLANFRQRFFISTLIFVVFLTQSGFAFGHGWGSPRFRHYPVGRSYNSVPFLAATLIIAGLEYHYWEGVYYRRMNNTYVVVQPPIGAVVNTIPNGYQTVIVDGTTYYIADGITYMYTPHGYQVVPQPKVIVINNNTAQVVPINSPEQNNQTPTPISSSESFTVNIPNNHGSYTPVVIKRSGTGFTGPQGEYYAEFPRIDQLKVMYGK